MSITLETLDEIERGLEGVTPGPWDTDKDGLWRVISADVEMLCMVGGDAVHSGKRNAAHIARLDPDTVRELVSLARAGLSRSGEAVAWLHGPTGNVVGHADKDKLCARFSKELGRDVSTEFEPLGRLASPPPSVPTPADVAVHHHPDNSPSPALDRLVGAAAQQFTNDALVKHMVDRFLAWELPADFNPDAGISFEPVANKGTEHEYQHKPSGTNLFDFEQATAMVRHMLAGAQSVPTGYKLVPEEPTEIDVSPLREEAGWIVEPYTTPRGSGIPTDGDMSEKDAASINREMRAVMRSELVSLTDTPSPSRREALEELIAAAQHVYDKLAGETTTVTGFDQERLGDALRALIPSEEK